MRNVLSKSLRPVVIATLFSGAICAQTVEKVAKNNPYAPSPASKQKAMETVVEPKSVLIEQVASIRTLAFNRAVMPHVVEVKTELPPKKKPSPTDLFTVGIGDVLAIEIRNGVTSTTICTVRTDGSIDFPLAGASVMVRGQSVEEISETLIKAVKLYEKPLISVTIRESASHTVLVTGLVAIPGTHHLRRDAVPLFVIRATATVDPKANKVNIRRASDAKRESHILADPLVDNILVYPGDEIEFTGTHP